MNRCLQLAAKGVLGVGKNPMVGSVIVHDNKIIGEGYHAEYGKAHAEVNAIKNVVNKELLKDSTLYVSLEPCSHFGKTPPCSDLILEMKIPRVVIATIDPFSEVSGSGIERLKNNGVEVTLGVLQEDARFLNRKFFVFHKEKRPYIILKWAESANGLIDIERLNNEKGSFPISHPESQFCNHQWRAEEDAIFVGYHTLKTDNPALNCRKVAGESPLRLSYIRDFDCKEWMDYQFFKDNNFYIFQNKERLFSEVKDVLYNKEIQSVIIEGGAETHEKFINEGLWDELRIIKSSKSISKGKKSAIVPNKTLQFSSSYLSDTIYFYTNPNMTL